MLILHWRPGEGIQGDREKMAISRATARVAPTIYGTYDPRSGMVGATLAVALVALQQISLFFYICGQRV
ncbi:MAG TPA: hypothetical protein VNE38_08525 [Ktedonobacteraceae bacterium]|nr:hypothetical protein [Ktedonobacteraceae bacterium]